MAVGRVVNLATLDDGGRWNVQRHDEMFRDTTSELAVRDTRDE